MPIRIIDNINDYRVVYNTSNDLTHIQDSVDLLFEKAMLKCTKKNNVKYLYPIFKQFAIEVRIIIYALMDYRELVGTNEFKAYEFCDWLAYQRRYRNYLILTWITKKLKEIEKDNYFYRKFEETVEANQQVQESNLKDYNVFDMIEIDGYKKSTLKNFTMNKTKIKKTLYLLGNTAFIDIYDNVSTTNKPVNEEINLKEDTLTVEMIRIKKAFGKVERRFKLDNWLF